MADLSDDISDSINRNIIELFRTLMRRWNARHYSNYEKLTSEQRKLKRMLAKWNSAHPEDPYREVSFKGAEPPHTAKDFATELEKRGYGDVRVHRHYVAVPQSQLEGVLRLARRLGFIEHMVDPMERVSLAVRCGDERRAAQVAEQLRKSDFDAEQLKVFPDQVACLVGRAEMPEFHEALAELGLGEDALSVPNDMDPVEAACAETPERGEKGHLEPEDLDRTTYLDRPATQRQIEAIERLVESGRASKEELSELGENPSIDEASDFLYMHGIGRPRSTAPADLEFERARQTGQRELIADGEVRTVMAEDREAPQTASLGEDAVDLPGGPDDVPAASEGQGGSSKNDPLEKQIGDLKRYEEAKRREQLRSEHDAPQRHDSEPALEER